jgi:hypothetical protein
MMNIFNNFPATLNLAYKILSPSFSSVLYVRWLLEDHMSYNA